MNDDWFEAVILDNTILGEAFLLNEECVFRHYKHTGDKKYFEIFNLKDNVVIVSGEEAKIQLRSARDRANNVIRAKDQGYINWKYQTKGVVKSNVTEIV
jgi:hypothetical protein